MDFDLFRKEKQQYKKFTNCYLTNDDLQKRFSNNEYETFKVQSSALLLLEKTRYDFYKLLFFSKNIQEVDWSCFSDRKLVLTIMLRRSKLSEWTSIFDRIEKVGKFEMRSKFVRMVIPLREKSLEDESSQLIKNPKDEDFESLQNLLEQHFDIYAEFIPSLNELRDFYQTTYIIKENNKIAAFAICQNIGNTTELRFLLVLDIHRGKGYGSLLMKYAIAVDKNSSRFFLWVNIDNKAAINLYSKMGFQKDDLLNCVLVNNNISMIRTKNE